MKFVAVFKKKKKKVFAAPSSKLYFFLNLKKMENGKKFSLELCRYLIF